MRILDEKEAVDAGTSTDDVSSTTSSTLSKAGNKKGTSRIDKPQMFLNK